MNPIQLSLHEKEAAKNVLRRMLIYKQMNNLDTFVGALNPLIPIKTFAHIVDTPLCSASLTVSQLRHFVVRNEILPGPPQSKAFLNLAYEKHQSWQTVVDQRPLYRRLQEIETGLVARVDMLGKMLKSFPRDKSLANSFDHFNRKLAGLQEMMSCMEKSPVKKNAFPVVGVTDFKIRGLSVQVNGPFRGSPSTKRKEMTGCTEIHSVGMRFYEEAQAQWLSKVGTNGIKVLTVHGNTTEFASRETQLANGSYPFKIKRSEWQIY